VIDVLFWDGRGAACLMARSGFLLGGETQGIADIVTATLWSTMVERFPKIEAMLEETAPVTAGWVGALPALAKLAAKSRRDYAPAFKMMGVDDGGI